MTDFKPVPVLIGLPGSGKSTLARLLAAEKGVPVVSTDIAFDKARADFNLPYTKAFLADFENRYGQLPLLDVFPTQGDFIEQMGVQPFRDFEEGLLVQMLTAGEFDGVAVDMGGAAFLRAPTREALKAAGFVTIFIDVPRARIAENLMKDYLASKESGIEVRGNYFKKASAAEQAGQSPIAALDAFSEENRAARRPFYAMADMTVTMDMNDSIINMACKVKTAYAEAIAPKRKIAVSLQPGTVS